MNLNRMKNSLTGLVASVLLIAAASALSGCKTTEANYRQAYERALEKRNEGLTQEEIAAIAREEAIPRTLFRGDSIPLKGMYVKCVEGGVDGKALKYNVVVASCKQRFNASSVMKRLAAAGCSSPTLLADADERYFIAAQTTASLDSAVATMHSLQGNSPVALRPPFPYILQSASAR